MKELGFTPSYEQLYSETDPCVANAVVIFGGGCSGITVSNEGLIFTNHHCGFGSIQQLSSVEHDYLKDGFVSQSKEEELPVPRKRDCGKEWRNYTCFCNQQCKERYYDCN